MTNVVPASNVALVASSGIQNLMQNVRPQWQGKSLIQRVERLLAVDPSSACQRLFNAAIHDLREKIVIAGVDIAGEAAQQFKLPPVKKDEDIENYPTSKIIDLAFRMGLLTRPEWRRVSRSYEIRRDLEHEDDEYEAGIEDCVYFFTTCVEVILSVDPVDLLRIGDVKEIVQKAQTAVPGEELLSDYERAPQPRQLEILKFLVSIALDSAQSDLIQQNAFTFLSALRSRIANPVIVKVATDFQQKVGRGGLDQRHARVATACGAMPYLKQSARREFYSSYLAKLNSVGTSWSAYKHHGELLREFSEFGGFASCPNPEREQIVKWMVLTYIGTQGGQTSYGNIRHVFYSNTASPLILEIMKAERLVVRDDFGALEQDEIVRTRISDQHIARRFEKLKDTLQD